jgi:hypothetical protein
MLGKWGMGEELSFERISGLAVLALQFNTRSFTPL